MRSRKAVGLRALLVAVVATAVVLVGTPAQAGAGSQTSDRTSVQKTTIARTVAPHVRYATRPGGTNSYTGPDFTWSGIVFKFNHTETFYIGSGAGMCALIVGKLPGVFAKVASLGCGVLAWYSAQLLYKGQCLKLTFGYNPVMPSMSPGGWNC